jgi:hypothetical protein
LEHGTEIDFLLAGTDPICGIPLPAFIENNIGARSFPLKTLCVPRMSTDLLRIALSSFNLPKSRRHPSNFQLLATLSTVVVRLPPAQ